MSDQTAHVDITAEQAIAAANRVLLRAVDGYALPLSSEDAKAVKAALWDARSQVGRERGRAEIFSKRIKSLERECDQLTGQVVDEERRATTAETRAALSLRHLRELVDTYFKGANYVRHMQDARVFLRNLE